MGEGWVGELKLGFGNVVREGMNARPIRTLW